MKRKGRIGRDRVDVVRRDWLAKLLRHRDLDPAWWNTIFRAISLGAMAAQA